MRPTQKRSAAKGVDVVIVGGGVCGISTALHLAKRGRRVVLVERETIGADSQASSINSGILESLSNMNTQLSPRKQLGWFYYNNMRNKNDVDRDNRNNNHQRTFPQNSLSDLLSAGTIHLYEQLSNEGHDIEFQRMPMLQLIENAAQLMHAQKIYPPMTTVATHDFSAVSTSSHDLSTYSNKNKIPLTAAPGTGALICKSLLHKLAPTIDGSHLLGAVLWPQCASAHPRKTMLALKKECLKAGVEIIENTEVTSIRQVGVGVGVPQKVPLELDSKNNSRTTGSGNTAGNWQIVGQLLSDRLADPSTDDPATRIDSVYLTAPQLVLAGGGMTDLLVRMALPRGAKPVSMVVPVIGQMFQTASVFPFSRVSTTTSASSATTPTTAAFTTTARKNRKLEYLICGYESDMYWDVNKATVPPNVTHEWRHHDDGDTVSGSGSGSGSGGTVWGPALTRHLYGKQTREGQYIFGGDRRVHPPQYMRGIHPLPRIVPDMHKGPYDHAGSVTSVVKSLAVTSQWGGIMPFSRDGEPIIGPIEVEVAHSHNPCPATGENHKQQQQPFTGLYIISGLGGSGFMKGAMAGYLLAASMPMTSGGELSTPKKLEEKTTSNAIEKKINADYAEDDNEQQWAHQVLSRSRAHPDRFFK